MQTTVTLTSRDPITRVESSFSHSAMCTLLCLAAQFAQAEAGCERALAPASDGYDFTRGISHWGDKPDVAMSKPARVNSISVNPLPIFDEENPKENNALYRWANRIHINTKPYVIKDQLLFDQGDVVDADVISESERVLREKKYVSDATIRVTRRCDEAVDLEIVTREVWTLTPEISLKNTGGNFQSKFAISDSNILGSGQALQVGFKNDVERNSYDIHYRNPAVARTRYTIRTHAVSSSDGHDYVFGFGLPFYALDTERSWGGSVQQLEEVLSQYQDGHTITDVRHDRSFAEGYWGWSNGLVHDFTQRFTLGLRYDRNEYSPTTEHSPPAAFPADEDYTYPFFRYELMENDYATAYNINQIYRTEDLHVGKHLEMEVGYAPGADSRLFFEGSYSDALIHESKMLLQLHSGWKGQWNPDTSDFYDTVMDVGLDYHRGQTDSRSLFIGLSGVYSRNLNPARQVILGGDNGLRGYDSFFQAGERSVSINIEQRLFTQYHLFQLARVGFAGFIDAGKVFNSNSIDGDGFHSAVGVGLRLAPSKSESAGIIHMDLAWPINSNDSMQFIVELRETF